MPKRKQQKKSGPAMVPRSKIPPNFSGSKKEKMNLGTGLKEYVVKYEKGRRIVAIDPVTGKIAARYVR